MRSAQGSSFASPSSGLLQDRNHVAIAAALRELERRRPAAVRDIDVSAGLCGDDAGDAGVWGTRTNTEDSLQNIKEGSDRAALDPRLSIDRARDAVFNKRMARMQPETAARPGMCSVLYQRKNAVHQLRACSRSR